MNADVKLIKHTGEFDHKDDNDPSFPFKLHLVMRPPGFMTITFVLLCGGTEEVIARGRTLEALSAWADKAGLKTHPRLLRYTITDGNDAVVEEKKR
jgi:hypothetical protein